MSKGRPILSAARIRRCVQVFFLLLFVGLVLLAGPQLSSQPGPAVKSFFLVDPLIMVATALAAHAVVPAALWSLAVIGVTLVMGRVFCGWVCPLGTIHAVASRLFRRRGGRRADRWSRWQLGKYYLLVGLLVMAALGCHWVCVLDPIVLLYRTTTVALLPAVQWVVEESSTAVFESDPGIGPLRLVAATEPAYRVFRDNIFVLPNQAFLGSGLIAVLFVGTLVANAWRRRFWCRYLCPLGALLGLLAWRPALRRCVDEEQCNQCDLCARGCHGAAAGGSADEWMASECLGCLNCSDACNRDCLRFSWVWPWRRKPAVRRVDLSRRGVLAAAAGGAAALSLLRASPQSSRLRHNPVLVRGLRYHPRLIRPPGARPEKEFLQRCTACGLCMKVCPTGGLQPTLAEVGLEGIWTPKLVPWIGYCDYNCNLCGQVCPTEAIEPLSVDEKQQTKIGLASFDITRCIPYAYGRDCMVCEEHCPIPDKAIYFLEVEILDREGQQKTVKQPHVDPDLCIGCGVCESVCPYKDQPAVRVFSANESRNPANQPILPDQGPY